MKYAIQVSKDNAGYIALCREFPKFVATSKNLEDLSQLTVKNLSAIIRDCLANAEYVPHSMEADEARHVWYPPIGIRFKVAISNGLIDKGWSRDDFAGAMGLTLSSMNNFFDTAVSTRLSTFDKAFHVLGLYPHLDVIESPGELFLDP
ncbi:hypothetical protein P3W43_10440 [Salinicola salarius]|uniref:hypothetical protein n=1 Tax=Salinicola salarius TaxID=430457 RepID=UPI0023E3B19E|nr:hypothetical protein [Salinicola salarius]MDF3919277.1 hypothetical protein [Salinicola salarius]